MSRVLCSRASFLSSSMRGWLRWMHIYHCQEGGRRCLLPLEPPTPKATDVTVGVGGVALYSRGNSPCIWYHSSSTEAPPTYWACLQLPKGMVTSVSIGRTHIVALADDHQVYATGGNHFGQCGHHGNNDEGLKAIPGISAQQAICGLDHTLFLMRSGGVAVCGWSADGQTGVGNYDNVLEPMLLDISNIESVNTCSDSSFAVTDDGRIYAWGNNEYGQLGISTSEQQVYSPVQVCTDDLDSKVVFVSTGGAFTGVLTSAGSVYVAGYPIDMPDSMPEQDGRIVIKPSELCKFRRLGTKYKVSSIHTGLNYLVACIQDSESHEFLVWGRSPLVDESGLKSVRVEKSVCGLSFGGTAVAALLTNGHSLSASPFAVCN